MASQWNLFPVELMKILEHHDAHVLGALTSRAQVHPQKVQRLRESQEYQGQFPVLSDNELKQVIAAFELDEEEERRLLAAILATGIEAKLVHRIGAKAALKAAQALLPIIEAALKEAEEHDDNPFKQVHREGGELFMSLLTQTFAEALTLIDSGTLALYQAKTTDPAEKQESLRQAREDFTRALAILDERATDAIRKEDDWISWRDEALAGLKKAQG